MTIAEWLNPKGQHSTGRTTHMTDPTSPAPEPAPEPRTDPQGTWSAAPDSEWLSEWAMIALSVGRVEMGYQLARLARAAQRCERHLGQHAAPDDRNALERELAAAADPEPLSPAAPDQTVVIVPGPPAAADPPRRNVTPTGSCIVPVNGGRLCHGVAFWDASTGRWVHMDPALEQDHQASVPPEAYDLNGGTTSR